MSDAKVIRDLVLSAPTVKDDVTTIRDLPRGALAVSGFDARAIAAELVKDAANVADQLLTALDGDEQLEGQARPVRLAVSR